MNRPKSSDLFRGIRNLETVKDKSGEYQKISFQEKYLLLILATFADPDGSNVFPGVPVLMKATNWAESTVLKWMKRVQDLQLLIPDGRHGYTRQFRLNIPGVTPERRGTLLTPDEAFTEEDLGDDPFSDEDQTEIMPTVTAPPARPPVTPPPEEEYQPPGQITAPYQPPGAQPASWDLLIGIIKAAQMGLATYERFVGAGLRRGYSEDNLAKMWDYYQLPRQKETSPSSQLLSEEPIHGTVP